MSSGSFSSHLKYRLWAHGPKMVVSAPGITSLFQAGRWGGSTRNCICLFQSWYPWLLASLTSCRAYVCLQPVMFLQCNQIKLVHYCSLKCQLFKGRKQPTKVRFLLSWFKNLFLWFCSSPTSEYSTVHRLEVHPLSFWFILPWVSVGFLFM